MNFGSEAGSTGRYVVDIDGALRTTDQWHLTAGDVVALHGRLAGTASVIWEINGESVPLAPTDRVRMDENSVAFFRTCEGPHFFRSTFEGARFGTIQDAIAA